MIVGRIGKSEINNTSSTILVLCKGLKLQLKQLFGFKIYLDKE